MSLSNDATFLERTQSNNKDKNYITYSEKINETKKNEVKHANVRSFALLIQHYN